MKLGLKVKLVLAFELVVVLLALMVGVGSYYSLKGVFKGHAADQMESYRYLRKIG